MKAGIHPKNVDTKVTCACGNEFVVKSNKPELHVEVCNKCHPFFTGEQGSATRTGRVEKFNRKYGIEK
jgi:large subunit ribosomal protein L31